MGVTVDMEGNIYMFDAVTNQLYFNNSTLPITLSGSVTTLGAVRGMACDLLGATYSDNRIYVCDNNGGTNSILCVTGTTLANGGTEASATTSVVWTAPSLVWVDRVVVDPSGSTLFVLAHHDVLNYPIVYQLSVSSGVGTLVSSLNLNTTFTSTSFEVGLLGICLAMPPPMAIPGVGQFVMSAPTLFINARPSNQILQLTSNGGVGTLLSSYSSSFLSASNPTDVFYDSTNYQLLFFNWAGGSGVTAITLNSYNGTSVSVVAGTTTGYVNGAGTAAKFAYAYDSFGVISNGSLYVSDGANYAVRRVDVASGLVTTLVDPTATTPGAPTGVSFTSDATSITATFTPPSSKGGAGGPIYYIYDTAGEYALGYGFSSPLVATGLPQGTSYTLVVRASNPAGDTNSSSSTVSTGTATQPGNPTNLSVSYSGTTGTLTFTAPANTGNAAIVLYAVYDASDTTFTYALFDNGGGTGTSITMAGLANGTTGYVLVAQNAGNAGSTGVSFTTTVATVPSWGAASVSWAAGDGSATVTFTAADDGGSAITAYRVRVYDSNTIVASNNGTVAPITVTGLTNGTTYRFVMVAVNAVGPSTDGDAIYVTPVSGGGGAGDPYVTTFSNISYKLPALDAPIRYFQTMEGGKLLTINAQLKTIERSDMEDDTLRSLIVLRKKMTTKQYINIIHKLMKPETLCFFERVSVQHGDQRLVVNLWDSKFEVVENTLTCAAEKVERPDLLLKAGGIYDGYKADTIRLTLGSTSVYLSVYDSPMIRNGISIESAALKGANGVIVNALSASTMTLRSLSSVEPVSTRDSLRAVTKVETFVDHEGVRSRNIVTYK